MLGAPMSALHSPVPADSGEAIRDLQDRIARFARTIFVISGVMLVGSVTADLAQGVGIGGVSGRSRIIHVLVEGLIFFVWRFCRGRTRRHAVLEALDAALTVALCTVWALLGIGVPASTAIEFSIMLGTTYTLIARAVIVPSSFGRTLWIGAVSVLPTIYFFVKRGMPFAPDAPPEGVRTFLIFSALWCAVAVFTSALQSRQLYGLRQQIREMGKLGQYTLEEKIGEGGMGVVYRATHAMLRRPAAIKLLLPDRTGEKDLARFEREVQLTSRLAHPNTISIFDYGRTVQGVFYYVMEYLDGFDLERLVEEEGALEPARVIRILEQVSGALCEAHALGLIHRDIKPANIILTERPDQPDVVKVVDFGLVKTLKGSGGDVALTNIDAITGTPMYLAPEAITAPDSVDGRADLYALGAVGYLLLTGKQVFEAATVVEMCSKHLVEVPVSPSERLGRPLPRDLETLILGCLAKAREQRPASAEAFRKRLLACADAGTYDVEKARSWWRDRAATLRTPRKLQRSGSGLETMAIDLRRREAD
jgi:eukaryotic-like serine/threonine-protein kinase